MRTFIRCFRADIQKTKHLSIWYLHILIPVSIAIVFLAYYKFAPWDAISKVEGYFQVLGIGLPFLIGLFCVMLSEQELAAGAFQVLLASPKRLPAFLSKLILLLSMGAFALFLASVLFGAGYSLMLRQSVVSVSYYLIAPFILLGSSSLLYIWHLFLSFRFNKGISIGVGMGESLISALFLTGLGDRIWSYTPCAWPAKFVTYALAAENGSKSIGSELNIAVCLCILTTIIALILFCIWACRWEGQSSRD